MWRHVIIQCSCLTQQNIIGSEKKKKHLAFRNWNGKSNLKGFYHLFHIPNSFQCNHNVIEGPQGGNIACRSTLYVKTEDRSVKEWGFF